jgi:SAM-dependent methyltransferase
MNQVARRGESAILELRVPGKLLIPKQQLTAGEFVGTSDHIGQSFRDVDRAPNPQILVDFLAAANSSETADRWERQILTLLDPRPGAHLLDVGCGVGDDVRTLAGIVGPTGRAVGVDNSHVMIEAAQLRLRGVALPIEFRVGDAQQLDFPDDSFDGCRVERTLSHVADPRQAVAEMVRVVKPGGPIVALEPDWDTMIVNTEDRRITRLIARVKGDSVIRNGLIGRQLPGLFHEAGLKDIIVDTVSFTTTDFSVARRVLDLDEPARLAQEQGLLRADEVAAWFAELQRAADAQRFFAALFGLVVCGYKPGSAS